MLSLKQTLDIKQNFRSEREKEEMKYLVYKRRRFVI